MAAHAHGIPVRQMLDEITTTAANAGLAPSHD
jgi:hypothetical protein